MNKKHYEETGLDCSWIFKTFAKMKTHVSLWVVRKRGSGLILLAKTYGQMSTHSHTDPQFVNG